MIVCTGPISSGTRLLTKIVSAWGFEAEHRSMPQWDRFWRGSPLERYIVIVRRADISVRSAYAQGHGDPELIGTDGGRYWAHLDHRMTHEELDAWWWKAMDRLAWLPDAYWLSYEALVTAPKVQLTALAVHLESETAEIPFEIYDGNEKWR